MQNLGCLVAIIIAVVTGTIFTAFQTWQGAVVWSVAVAFIVAIAFMVRKGKRENDKKTLLDMADKLEALSKDLKPIETSGGLAVKAGESVYFEVQPVGLIEYRSTGSSYSGSNQSVSVPIVKGVRYSVGRSQGSITRNPEELTQIDTGKAIFTNKRIIFVGPNNTREWDLSKLVDMTAGPNGQTISISVSNRQKTSGLSSIGRENITPGFYASIIQQLHSEGLVAAKKNALEIAEGIRQVFIDEETEKSQNKSAS